ncbi:MAG: hypothetical protein M3Z04_03655, partial [Chloroflexota bacterium]|nr:hypothetical protein [Chloroflexota bacterium]
MKPTARSFQRTITAAGLGLLALALLVVGVNLLAGNAIPDGLRGPWTLLKVLMAGVLLVSWVLLNVPQPKAPSGDFVLAVAQFGELQPTGTRWAIVPGQRSFWDQLRALLPPSIAGSGATAFERLSPRPRPAVLATAGAT